LKALKVEKFKNAIKTIPHFVLAAFIPENQRYYDGI